MEHEKIERISELTRISRERELTPEEQAERAELLTAKALCLRRYGLIAKHLARMICRKLRKKLGIRAVCKKSRKHLTRRHVAKSNSDPIFADMKRCKKVVALLRKIRSLGHRSGRDRASHLALHDPLRK